MGWSRWAFLVSCICVASSLWHCRSACQNILNCLLLWQLICTVPLIQHFRLQATYHASPILCGLTGIFIPSHSVDIARFIAKAIQRMLFMQKHPHLPRKFRCRWYSYDDRDATQHWVSRRRCICASSAWFSDSASLERCRLRWTGFRLSWCHGTAFACSQHNVNHRQRRCQSMPRCRRLNAGPDWWQLVILKRQFT